MKTKEIKKELKQYLDQLQTNKREDGTEYVCFKLESITEDGKYHRNLSNIIHNEASIGEDFKYQTIWDFLEWAVEDHDFESLEDLEEQVYEWCEGQVSIYTWELTAWLALDIRHVYYLTEAIEIGVTDGFKLLAMAQYLATKEIADAICGLIPADEEVEG